MKPDFESTAQDLGTSHRLSDPDILRGHATRLRELKNCTQAEIAEKLGVSQAALSAFELGNTFSLRPNRMRTLVELVETWEEELGIYSSGLTDGQTAHKNSKRKRNSSHIVAPNRKQPRRGSKLHRKCVENLRYEIASVMANGPDESKTFRELDDYTPADLLALFRAMRDKSG